MYPKLKYQGVEVKPGQHHTENPGFIYQTVAGPAEEAALGEGWYDSPRAAIDAFAGVGEKAIEEQAAAIHDGERVRPTEPWPVESERAEKRRRR